MGLPFEEYAAELRKLERIMEIEGAYPGVDINNNYGEEE